MNDSDETLVVKARDGDRSAFEELIRRTSRLVLARLYLETGRADEAEDLLQETLLLAYRSVRRVTDPKGFRSWLLTIAHNVVITSARRAARQKRASSPVADPDTLGQVADHGQSPEAEIERKELRERVLAVLRSLPEDYRLPLTLRYLVGADYETIGQQLGLSNGALRGLLHRGLKMLRARLPEDLSDPVG